MSNDRLRVGVYDTIDPARLVPAERDLVTGQIASGPRRGDKDRPDSRDATTRATRRLGPVALGVGGLMIVALAATAMALQDSGEPGTQGQPSASAPATSGSLAQPQAASTSRSSGPSTPLGPQVREYNVVSYTLTNGAISGSPETTRSEWDGGTLSMTCGEGRCAPIYMAQRPREPVSVPDAQGTHPFTAQFEPLNTDGCQPLNRVATGTVTFAGKRMTTAASIPQSEVTCQDGTIIYSSQRWTVVGELVE